MRTTRRRRRRRRKQKGGAIFGAAAKIGASLGRRKDYHRMSRTGFADFGGTRRKQPWLAKKLSKKQIAKKMRSDPYAFNW